MKILCVFSTYWPAFQFGGPIFSVHCLNKALVRKGIDVTVYTTNAGLVGKVPLNQEVNLDGVKVHYFGFTKLFEFMGTIGWQFSKGIAKALKDNLKDFDLIYIVNIWSYPAAIAARYSRLYRKPYILVPSGMLYPNTLSKKIWKKWPYYHFIVKRDLKYASAIHYTTEDEAEKTHSFLNLSNRKIILPNGVDLSEFYDSLDKKRLKARYPHLKDKKIILFLGRIHWIKGLDILASAFAELIRGVEDVRLVIVGQDYGYSTELKKILRILNIENKVTFTGFLSGRAKVQAYIDSDVYVLPSIYESFSTTVLEALASGTPVIVTDRCCIADAIEGQAGLVVPYDKEQLRNALLHMLSDDRMRLQFSERGKLLVREQFNWEKIAEQIENVYQECRSN